MPKARTDTGDAIAPARFTGAWHESGLESRASPGL